MTDRELLELAAKAADIEHGADRIHGGLSITNDNGLHTYFPIWNPLADDGDALRLAIKLRLMIAWDRWEDNDYVCIRHRDLDEEIGIQIDQNPDKTTRRAIVRAAAEIGSAM